MSQEEVEDRLATHYANGNTGLLKRLSKNRHGDAHRIAKRGAETHNFCTRQTLFQDTEHGKVPVIIYKWLDAQCIKPHVKSTYKVKCASYYVHKDGKEELISHIEHEVDCPTNEYCFDRERETNDAGEEDPNGIPDISCAQREKPGTPIQGIKATNARDAPVEVCTDKLNLLDERFARYPGTMSRPLRPRKFLFSAEFTNSDGTPAAAQEMYIREYIPTDQYTETVVEKMDTQNIQAVVTYDAQDFGSRLTRPGWVKLYQACVVIAFHAMLLRYEMYHTVWEMDQNHWKRNELLLEDSLSFNTTMP